jgi:mRNA interferase MazF
MSIKRGDIFRVSLEPTIGHEQKGTARPCVVISRDVFNQSMVLVVPLTTGSRARFPIAVPVPSAGSASSLALTLQTRGIDRRRIISSMGSLSNDDLSELESALRVVTDL